MIKLEQVSKTYGSHTALHPFSATIQPGTCLALCGGNGAGKSTLLSILAGIVRPDSGRVTGVEQRHIGYMPDSLQIPAGVSARRWLMYMAQLRGTKRNKIEEVLDMVGLTDAAGREPSSYSRGMMQRLLFAQMILDEPDILLMDEPGNGLDPFWVEEWKQWIEAYRKRGATIIFSSHLLHDVLAVSERILLMHNGRLLKDEPAEAWRSDVRSPEQRFLDLTKSIPIPDE
ncbi:ABC transporter ATP-binding protein [Aneurinibacillus aneurinilyticus]|uniref:ABC transporter ATP-binding protein n=1 Tax=Aneurinibacillus aneurinilyticus TaxID=1391 RepID=UPI003526B8A5